jgi:hypothetical protein
LSKLRSPTIADIDGLVRNTNCKEVNLGRTIALVIVAGLEVAIRVIKVKGVEFLESLTIEANG